MHLISYSLKRNISGSLQSLWTARRVLHEAKTHTARALSSRVALPAPLDAENGGDAARPYHFLLRSVSTRRRRKFNASVLPNSFTNRAVNDGMLAGKI